MSLVTTCPACATTFLVTPEQLSAHRGDVRCGQCQHIFSALRQLEEVTPAVTPRASPEAAATEAESVAAAPPVEQLDLQPSSPQPEVSELPMSYHREEQTESLLPVGAAVDFELDFDGEVDAGRSGLDAETKAVAANAGNVPDGPEPVAEPVSKSQPAAAVPGFMQPEKKRGISFWALLPLALLLLVAAITQSVYFMRTQVAAHYPHLRPWLEQACARVGCTVELPRQADLFSIEDSDLQSDAEHAGVLVLVSALYNHAPYPQAYPLMELTLTDTYDKPVLRRTFAPHEYLPAGTRVEAGIAADGEIHSRLPLVVEGEKPAGYRLYVRY